MEIGERMGECNVLDGLALKTSCTCRGTALFNPIYLDDCALGAVSLGAHYLLGSVCVAPSMVEMAFCCTS